MLGANLYWCPWSPKYKKEIRHVDKRLHSNDCDYIIVVGIDFEENIIYCKEKNKRKELVSATFDDIINLCKKIIYLINSYKKIVLIRKNKINLNTPNEIITRKMFLKI